MRSCCAKKGKTSPLVAHCGGTSKSGVSGSRPCCQLVLHSAPEFSVPENVQPDLQHSRILFDMSVCVESPLLGIEYDRKQGFDPDRTLLPPIDLTIAHLHLTL
jgi:hypothetical protein